MIKLTREQLMAGATSLAGESYLICQEDNAIWEPEDIRITEPTNKNGWKAESGGWSTYFSDSEVVIRALVLVALQGS